MNRSNNLIETISPRNITALTQVERIIAHMFDHTERVWWFAGDFMQPRLDNTHKHFVGYEASARLTDAIERYNADPEIKLFSTDKKDKFRIVRINWDQFEACLKKYPRLIAIAETTDVINHFSGLAGRVEEFKPKPPKKKYKSYG